VALRASAGARPIRSLARWRTLLITNDLQATTKQPFARDAERMSIENELDAYVGGFHLDALTSAVPLNVDLDASLSVIAGNLYRLLARRLPCCERATPDRAWRHFPRHHRHHPHHRRRAHRRPAPTPLPPVLIDAGLADQTTRSPGSTDANYASASHPAEPRHDSLTGNRG
jgi:hypothetical protein